VILTNVCVWNEMIMMINDDNEMINDNENDMNNMMKVMMVILIENKY